MGKNFGRQNAIMSLGSKTHMKITFGALASREN